MKNIKISVNNLVYSKLGAGVIVKCHKNYFGDSETVYEVNYFDKGYRIHRLKDFDEII